LKLRGAISTPSGKKRYVRRLFATIADRYDLITVLLSYGLDRRWKNRLISLAAITSSDRVLDVACGTGDLLLRARQQARLAVGLDVTPKMLVLAAAKTTPPPHVVAADMQELPFPSSSFTVVTAGYGLRNVPQIELAIEEIARVLAPHGRLLSLDFNRPTHPLVRAAYLTYLTIVGSVLGVVLHRDPDTYRYIPESIRNYPGAEGVARILAERGFTDVHVIPLLGGLMAIHRATRGG
jgi:demethylmenaquinone methyltransferase/2-methoxy-6-polyprenyl-1,4-benzoquinol methylase